MSEQFPPSEFDEWAPEYDESVSSESGFPFDGYSRVLRAILDQAAPPPAAAVLDLGIGTGNLAALFAERGCQVWGLDFSAEMLARARRKLPAASLVQADLRGEWQPAFQRRFDCIVSAYTFHHFPLEEKLTLVQRLLGEHLAPGGRLVIGDIAFQDAAAEDVLRRSLAEDWAQEYYWLADRALEALNAAGLPTRYTQISSCAGVFTIQ